VPHRRHSVLLGSLTVERPGGSQQVILDELRRAILDGAVPPGTPIPLAEVAEHFGVSRIPVRESLKTLIGEGLVAHRANSGYMVAQLTAAELGELYVARESLEAASLAAAVGNASEADFATAIDMNALLEHAIREDDAVAYHRQSRRFHAALTGPSRMYRLLRMLETAWNLTEPVQPMVHVTPDDRIRLHADHGEMLQAFLTRDVERLLGAAERHARRLNSVIATLSFETGLLAAEKDISSPQ